MKVHEPSNRWSKYLVALGLLSLALASCVPSISLPTVEPTPTASLTPSPQTMTPIPSSPLPSPTPRASPSPTPTPFATLPAPTLTEHRVEAGDTLLNLALQYDVPMAAIQLHNDLGSSTNLQVGELLEIPPPVEWEGAGPFWVVYEVRAGETLGGIAAAHDVDLDRLREVNGLSYADLLTVGQSLVLPVEELTEVSQPPRPTPTLVPLTPSSTPTPPTSPLPTPTEEVEPPPAPPPVSEAPADADAMAAELFRLINEERARHDLPPYVWNETLAQAARLHAADCSERGSCSHTGSDGSTVTERVKRLGYPAGWAAETIMTTDTPAGALEWWMDETPPNDPHRQMILHDWFTEIGIGIAPSRWGYYFVADYGRPK